ncbi:MAG TPA: pseudouridine synthase [Luteimonas sp.]|nr:pseudouridine synthase [Luteimonas sp.]
MTQFPPAIDGLGASRLQLPPGPWRTVLDALCAQFPAIDRAQWLDRMARGRVLGEGARVITPETNFRVGAEIHYYREVVDEPRIPFDEVVLHADAHLVVADKPHFLPVTPAGGFVAETLLTRLMRRLGNLDLVPLHRIDRATAGLVLFSANAGTRAQYQALFRDRTIRKNYEALAPALPGIVFPLVRKSRLVRGDPFFRMRESDGAPNAETNVDVIERSGDTVTEDIWRYALQPVTGKKHQLRVHMAALGAPISNDAVYPILRTRVEDYSRPLKLLAKSLAFIDPVSGDERRFESRFTL